MMTLGYHHDGILEADEIANAAQSLKKLDKNGEGKSLLTNYGLAPEPGAERHQ